MVITLMDIFSIRREVFCKINIYQRMIKITNGKHIFIDNIKSQYIIFPDGRVYSEKSNKFLKPFLNPCGYLLVDLHVRGKSYYRQVHRLVAMYYIPNPKNLPIVNHLNGDKTDCDVSNLEWCTQKENVDHAWKTGLIKPRYGEDNPACKYTEETIHQVCQLLEYGKYNYKTISDMTGVNITVIYDIRKRGKWKMISSLYDIPEPSKSPWDELRPKIQKMIIDGFSKDEIFEELKLEPNQRNKNYVTGWISYYKTHPQRLSLRREYTHKQ